MKCRYCGHEIPEGMLYCEACGKEVRIVPDYNPLDDMLTAQIKVSINEEDGTSAESDYDMLTGNISARSRNNTGARQNTGARRGTGSTGRNTGRSSAGRNTGRNTTGRMMSEKEQRRRQMERRKAMKRKKRRKVLIILAVLVVAAVAIGIVCYQNSYSGIVNKGYSAQEDKAYNKAETYFKKAISKKPEKAEAYIGLSKVYIAQDELDKAEDVFLNPIDRQPKNADLYEACVKFYMDTDQKMEIPVLLEDVDDSVAEKLGGYIVDGPSFSLDDEEVFEEVQELTLKSDEAAVYYTTDGSEPNTKSEKYEESIHLEEGENIITAIAVNKEGIPSLPVKKTFTIELPVEDAPAVSPSTGQYSTATQIEIKVPDGYEAYYTMDKSDPTTSSTKYEGPIDMPEGETIFKAVLVNSKGRMSGITTRNYMYEPE